MRRPTSAALAAVFLAAAFLAAALTTVSLGAQDGSGFTGRWAIDRESSEFPRELGFNAAFVPAGRGGAEPTGESSGGRGRSGGQPASVFHLPPSQDDAVRTRLLTDEVRNPPARLTIAETAGAVTITDDMDRSRTLRTDGRQEVIQLGNVPVTVVSRMEGGRLVVLYHAEEGRDLRYTYSRTASPAQLIVEVKFVERGGRGDGVRRVYQPAGESTAPPAAPPPGSAPGAAPAPAGAAALPPPAGTPGPASQQAFDQQPDAELKGLTRLGVVVEELGPEATACGLHQDAIEAAVSQGLSDAGLRAVRNSDEDTYLYVNVMTTRLSAGLCVSRYDAFLYSHTTTTLSHQARPVLVQVSLLHKGGLAGGSPDKHGEAVVRGVKQYAEQFAARIRDANKR